MSEIWYTEVSLDKLIDVYIKNCLTKKPITRASWFDCKKQEVILQLGFLKDE